MGRRIAKRSSVVMVRYPFKDLTGTKVWPPMIFTPCEFLKRMDGELGRITITGGKRSYLVLHNRLLAGK